MSDYDPCFFRHPSTTLFVFLYVDNINVIAANAAHITEVKEHLFGTFEMTDEDESYFLGMNIKRTDSSVQLHQPNAVGQIIRKFGLEDIPIKRTPVTKIPPRQGHEGVSDEH